MTAINLKDFYPWYTEDTYIEVTDEVAAEIERFRRDDEAARIRRLRAGAYFSLDCDDGIECEALRKPPEPWEDLFRGEQRLIIHQSLAQLSPSQRRRIIAFYYSGKTQTEIATLEGVSQASVSESIGRGLDALEKKLKDYFR